VTPSRSFLGSGQSRRRARQRQPTSQSRVERLNSTSKTSIPALALMGLPRLAATSAGAVEPIARLRCASGSNFIAEPCDPGVGGLNLAEVGGRRPIHSLHLGRSIPHATTSLDVCPNHFGRPKKYDVSQNSFGPPERCVDSPAGPADLLGAKTVHRQSSAPRKGAIYECAFAHYRRRGPQYSTGADGASRRFRSQTSEVVVRHSPALTERRRAMKIVFTSRLSRATQTSGRKSSSTLRPIARPWIKRQAGKRL
jgi:hypothetical protein